MNRFICIKTLVLAAALAAVGCVAPAGQGDVGQTDDSLESARVISVDGQDHATTGTTKERLENAWSHPGEKNTGPQPDPWVGTSPNDGPQPDPWHPPRSNSSLVPGAVPTDPTSGK